MAGARREHVTATDIPVLLGISPWKCEQDLADEKLNGNGQESTLRMRVGNALEDLIAEAYAEQTGRKVRRVRGLWESARIPWAAASPDATAAGRLVELKWSGRRSRFAAGCPRTSRRRSNGSSSSPRPPRPTWPRSPSATTRPASSR